LIDDQDSRVPCENRRVGSSFFTHLYVVLPFDNVNPRSVKSEDAMAMLILSTDGTKKKAKGQIPLTERQMRIIETINKNDHITNKMIREMFKLSDEGALKEIKKAFKTGRSKIRG
jgi:predicted HTH transcriptional regulator